MNDQGRLATAVLVSAVIVSAASCGTRVDGSAGRAQPRLSGAVAPSAQVSARPTEAGGGPAATERATTTAPGVAMAPTGSSGNVAPPARPVEPAPARGTGAAVTSSGGASGNSRPGSPPSPAEATPTPDHGAGVAPGGAPTKKSPVIVAQVGTMTGPAGATLIQQAKGLQVWVKYVNAKGGVNGHPVQLLQYDDGTDPARHRAQVQEAVEKEHAVAFLDQLDAVTGSKATYDYIASKGIPVIGTDTGRNEVYKTPIVFPLGASGKYYTFSTLAMAAKVAVPEGKTKLGSMACAEAQPCAEAEGMIMKSAKAMGFDYVFHARPSIAQPDFTAECLGARNAGVEVLYIAMDINSHDRIAASCARQGFRPRYVSFANLLSKTQAEDPNLDGTLVMINGFPWFQSGTPATDEFQDAMRQFGAGLPPAGGIPHGWRAGKAFEKAAAQLPEPPTSASILAGLWSFRDETLGGLTYPLTFVQGQAGPARACWFTASIQDRTFKTLDGNKLSCSEPPVSLD